MCNLRSALTIVCLTGVPSLGGRAWPTVLFDNPVHEYAFALWCNSTLGLLCHWWMANKSQDGRGTSTVTSIPTFGTLNLRRLSPEQHEAARAVFDGLQGCRFLPFDQIDEDESRALLDRSLIEDVLGLPRELCAPNGPLEKLRAKIAREPQIHSGKKSRVVFTPDGEHSVRR